MSLTEVVLTSGKRMPTGGPGTVIHKKYKTTNQARIIIIIIIFNSVE